MNSESEKRLSAREMRDQYRTNLAKAGTTQTAVILTDSNWGALIKAMQELGETSFKLREDFQSLLSSEQMSAMLTDQLDLLLERQEEAEAELFRVCGQIGNRMTEASSEIEKLTQESIQKIQEEAKEASKSLASQAGNASEQCFWSYSKLRDTLEWWQERYLLISLIPAAVSVILCILQWIF